ncbi:phosphomevalonate kinase isoform X1 [Dermacentor variabilis]|uniref:phosphomevalonate kinase isoform X1 n=2 Tax=Dermacentor variabilis TaxID=34621 RepID=UPI003F5C1BFC
MHKVGKWQAMAENPKVILVFSGKRKSGKDYITETLRKRIGDDKCAILRLSEPIKEAYAKEHNLDYNRLLDSSDYKELYRAKMVAWGEEKRNQDLSFFCRLAVKKRGRPEFPVWMVSDARRESDIEYFRETFTCPTFTVRVRAREGTRRDRGWVQTPGIDDATTECGLDHVDNWDFVINNNDDDNLEGQLESVLQAVHEHCS